MNKHRKKEFISQVVPTEKEKTKQLLSKFMHDLNVDEKRAKLLLAIRELNNAVADDLGEDNISDEAVMDVYNNIKDNEEAVQETLSDYEDHLKRSETNVRTN